MSKINKEIDELKYNAVNSIILKDYNEALKYLQAAEVLDSKNPDILMNMGIVYVNIELYTTASEYFKKLIELELKYIDELKVLKLLSLCYINTKEYDNAIDVINKILTIETNDIEALNMKAYCQNEIGEVKNAIYTYKSVLKIDKNNKTSLNSSAYIMAKNNINLPEALKIMHKIYKENNAAYNDTLGLIYLKLKDAVNAEKYLQRAKKLKPFNSEINQNIELLKELQNN